ncbi:MAG TPA: hypothetical protein VGN57_18775 [Pirellulaceae bacterium]|jgi:nitrous oxide reductase accessory protein NosL|nr:hypothetical protein [Pirellulaceae bacterium]
MKKTLFLSISVIALALAGCDNAAVGGATSPTTITPERQAEIDAHEKAVEDEERVHQAG